MYNEAKEDRVAVIGDRDSIYGFACAGLEIFPAANAEQGLRTLRDLVEQKYVILYITESLYQELEPQLKEYHELPLPAIIPIPGVVGNSGIGLRRVRQSVERAVGSDILFGDQ